MKIFISVRNEKTCTMQLFDLFYHQQVLSFTHPVSFHSAETFESLLDCLKMEDEKVAEAALQIFKNTGSKMEESFPHIKSYVLIADYYFNLLSYSNTLLFSYIFRSLLQPCRKTRH